MVNHDPSSFDQQMAHLQGTVAQLQQVLRRMHAEREMAMRRRRRRLLLFAGGVSIVLHIGLLVYLALMHRTTGGDGGEAAVAIEFASMDEQPLTTLEALDTQELLLSDAVDLSQVSIDEPDLSLRASSPLADLSIAAPSAVDGLSGSGDGDGSEGLAGAGAGASYFGISSRGTRFAYIIDRSGSMNDHNRMTIAMSELARSIQGLPDYAYFHIRLFSTGEIVPPMQNGWVQARRSNVIPLLRWLSAVDATGGTLPRPSFEAVYALDVRPDVIFFMTDGIIPHSALTAAEIASFNSTGKRVVINTIAFGDQGSEALLRQIARESGGTYRYIPDGGTP